MLILLAGIQQGAVSGNTIYAMPASFAYLGNRIRIGVFAVAGCSPPWRAS